MAVAKQKFKEKEDLKTMAKNLFDTAEKEAYHLGDLAIHNMEDLMDHLEGIADDHAPWLADWIEYLGDKKTAKAIRTRTGDFKDIIRKRHKELSKHRT